MRGRAGATGKENRTPAFDELPVLTGREDSGKSLDEGLQDPSSILGLPLPGSHTAGLIIVPGHAGRAKARGKWTEVRELKNNVPSILSRFLVNQKETSFIHSFILNCLRSLKPGTEQSTFQIVLTDSSKQPFEAGTITVPTDQ